MMCSKCFVFVHSHSLLSCHHTTYYFSSLARHTSQCCCFFRVLLFICLTVCYYSKFLTPSLGVAAEPYHHHLFCSSVCDTNSTTTYNKQLLVLYFALNTTHTTFTLLLCICVNMLIFSLW